MYIIPPLHIQWIRALYDTRLATQSHIARQFGLKTSTVGRIVHRATYTHIPDDTAALLLDNLGKNIAGIVIPSTLEEIMEHYNGQTK